MQGVLYANDDVASEGSCGCVICCTILMRLSGERIDLFFLVNAGPQRRSRRALHVLIDERPDDFDAPLTKIVALCLADLRVAGPDIALRFNTRSLSVFSSYHQVGQLFERQSTSNVRRNVYQRSS